MITIKVTELKSMARLMAEKAIKLDGAYYCLIDGKKIKVVSS